MLSRRQFLQSSLVSIPAIAAGSAFTAVSPAHAAEDPRSLVIDCHQHLWDLKRQKLPWLSGVPPILNKTFGLPEYREATAGLNIRSLYMEVDVAPEQLAAEAEHVISLAKDPDSKLVAAVIGGRPEDERFPAAIESVVLSPYVKGIRRVLHGDGTPPGTCLGKTFVKSIRWLGEHDRSFDLVLKPTNLSDGVRLSEECPDTRFILDHCGNADARAFNPKLDPSQAPAHKAADWKRDIDRLAKRPNVICKISGVIAFLPEKVPAAESLAPIVNHCLDAFGPERVVFGSDWPVCLLGRPLEVWVAALTEIIRTRPAEDQRKLWSGNALRHYKLEV